MNVIIYMRFHYGSKNNNDWTRWLACSGKSGKLKRVGNLKHASVYDKEVAEFLISHESKHPKRGLWKEFKMRKLVKTNSTQEV